MKGLKMFGPLCEGSNRITCEPCDSNVSLSVVIFDCWGVYIEKVLCVYCKELSLDKEQGAW